MIDGETTRLVTDRSIHSHGLSDSDLERARPDPSSPSPVTQTGEEQLNCSDIAALRVCRSRLLNAD